MALGLGIAALIVTLIGFFIPIYGYFVMFVGAIIATIAALAGDKACAIAVTVINAVSAMMFSPILWMAAAGQAAAGERMTIILVVVLTIAAPVVGIILRSTGRLVIGARAGTQ